MFKIGDKVIVTCEDLFSSEVYYKNGTVKTIYGDRKNLYSVEIYDGTKFVKWNPLRDKDIKLDIQYYREQRLEMLLND